MGIIIEEPLSSATNLMRKLRRFKRYIGTLMLRNRQTFGWEPLLKNQVRLEYYQREENVGDQLAPVIFEWMLHYHNLENQRKGIIHLLTLGSLLGSAEFDAVVWGTGIVNMDHIKRVLDHAKKLRLKYDVRAVRGPLSRQILEMAGYHVPTVCADPGILMPLIYMPQDREKIYDICVIHHFEADQIQLSDPRLHYVQTRTSDYQFFIDEIVRSKLVISSSLHGLILAEAYGVPAILLNENTAQLIKYMDYYLSTDRYGIRMAENLNQALSMEPMPLPDLRQMQQALIDSFPCDLFKKRIHNQQNTPQSSLSRMI